MTGGLQDGGQFSRIPAGMVVEQHIPVPVHHKEKQIQAGTKNFDHAVTITFNGHLYAAPQIGGAVVETPLTMADLACHLFCVLPMRQMSQP
ncbi:hypothetical protein [Desulfobulbus propionicus]